MRITNCVNRAHALILNPFHPLKHIDLQRNRKKNDLEEVTNERVEITTVQH